MIAFGSILTIIPAAILLFGVPIINSINYKIMINNIGVPWSQKSDLINIIIFKHYAFHFCPWFIIIGIFCVLLGYHWEKGKPGVPNRVKKKQKDDEKMEKLIAKGS